MLNVPNSVKTLYQTDGVRKNFRVHFPNGEFADITNDNVVSEKDSTSVRFTESLCSQSTFKFGLAEASVLEFETVGIGNMYGMTIEASIEIDTSSLSAAQISAIQSNQGDGTLVLASASDIGYGFYRIPLGVFRVDSCPRNHGAMAHRKVTAYGLCASLKTSKFENYKLFNQFNNSSYPVDDLLKLICANICNSKSEIDHYLTTGIVTLPNSAANPVSFTVNGVAVSGNIYCKVGDASLFFENELVWVDLKNYSYYSIKSAIGGALALLPSVQPTTLDGIMAQLELYNQATFGPSRRGIIPSISIGNSTGLYKFQENGAFYFNWRGNIMFPTRVALQFTKNGTTKSIDVQFNDPAVYKASNLGTLVPCVFAPTVNPLPNMYQYMGCYDLRGLINGYAELNAQFGTYNRGNALEMIRLDNTSPVSVLPSNYSECWWDEYDVDTIGTVNIAYQQQDGNTLQEAVEAVTIGDGTSEYDMQENEALKNLANMDLATVSNLVTSLFAPYADTAGFTPTELTMQGWPWLEAGDALQITAEDGTVVDTYALRVEMSGIQHLEMQIVSEGGEIIGEAS